MINQRRVFRISIKSNFRNSEISLNVASYLVIETMNCIQDKTDIVFRSKNNDMAGY